MADAACGKSFRAGAEGDPGHQLGQRAGSRTSPPQRPCSRCPVWLAKARGLSEPGRIRQLVESHVDRSACSASIGERRMQTCLKLQHGSGRHGMPLAKRHERDFWGRTGSNPSATSFAGCASGTGPSEGARQAARFSGRGGQAGRMRLSKCSPRARQHIWKRSSVVIGVVETRQTPGNRSPYQAGFEVAPKKNAALV